MDPDAPGVIFQRMCDGEELRDIGRAWQVPKGRFLEWFTTQHSDLFDAALKVRAADYAIEAMNAALAATPEDVSVRKLQADVALKLASKYDRARFGEMVRIEKSVSIGVDAGLLGTAGELLRLTREKVVAGVEVPRLPSVHEMI